VTVAIADDARWLDGNAAGGLLASLFGTDMTASPRSCGACGQTHPVAAHRLYLGAGLVLRCPTCGDIALRSAGEAVELRGIWRVSAQPDTRAASGSPRRSPS
jgi:hypothetical protein